MLQLSDLALTLGWIFWGGFFLVQIVVLSRIKGAIGRVIGFLVVSAVFFGPMVPGWIKKREFQERQAKARAVFEERCKTAGEKIYRTVDDVEGVLLPKIRQRTGSDADPMVAEAAAWNESHGDFYIYNLLLDAEPSNNAYGKSLVQTRTSFKGFSFVEVPDPATGTRYRYTWIPGVGPKKEVSPSPMPPRYLIDYEDEVRAEDRSHWIAQSSIRIVDTSTYSAMAELIYFKFESGLGSRAGFRQPWAFAISCPNVPVIDPMHRFFADKVLRTGQRVK